VIHNHLDDRFAAFPFAGQRSSGAWSVRRTGGGDRGIACLAALPETHQILQKTCREFANAELVPKARHHDREELYPAEQVRQLGELGLMAVTVREEYGEYWITCLLIPNKTKFVPYK